MYQKLAFSLNLIFQHSFHIAMERSHLRYGKVTFAIWKGHIYDMERSHLWYGKVTFKRLKRLIHAVFSTLN